MSPLQTLAIRALSSRECFGRVGLRPHRSTLLLSIAVLIVVALANVPGWRVAYLDPLGNGMFQPGIGAKYDHGWPLTYLHRKARDYRTGISFSAWDLLHGVVDFRWLPLAGDIVVGIGIVVFAGTIIEARRRRRQSCCQFHLGELLAFVTLVAIGLSFYACRRKEYIEECRVYESIHRDENGPPADWTLSGPDWQLEGPDWLLPILGEDRYNELFVRPCAAEAGPGGLREVVKLRRLLLLRVRESSDQDTALLARMPSLEAVQLMWDNHEQRVQLPSLPHLRALNAEIAVGAVSDPLQNWRIRGIAGLKSLESLSFTDDQFDDASMAELDGLVHLHWLDLSGTKITAAGLRNLEKATEIDWLLLSQTQIGDDALRIIARMRILSYLDLSETRVTDAGLESLKPLKDLHNIHLNGTSVTTQGVRRLQQALPNCEIEWSPPSP